MTTTRAAALKAAQDTISKAQRGDRDLSSDERKFVEAKFAIVEKADAMAEGDALLARISKASGGGGMSDGGGVGMDRSEIKTGLVNAIRSKNSVGFNVPFRKAALTTGGADLPGEGTYGSPQPLGAAVVALRELFEAQTVSTGSVRYYRIGSGSADIVAEGEEKPDAGIAIEPVDAALAKIATTFSFTDELAEDAEFLVQFVLAEATRSVLVRENELVVAAFNDATGTLTANGTAGDAIDVIGEAIGAAEAVNGVTPSTIVINPADLAAVRATKASGSGQYNVDPLGAGPTTLHGVEVAPTPAVAEGTVYLVSAGLGVFYQRHDQLRIEAGYAGGDWLTNKATTRVEERVLPAVVRPALLTEVTLTA